VSKIPESRFFVYRNGRLFCEAVELAQIAREVGTPCYVYSWNAIREAFNSIDRALTPGPHLVAYALKANGNLALLRRLAQLGAGADIVSGGELARAMEAGVRPERIVFSGVGKLDREIESALAAGVRSIHAESPAEIDAIEAIAQRMNLRAPVSLRVNPDVDPKTHPYIATGLKQSKFGITIEAARDLLPRVLGSRNLQLEGLACHIGSLIGSTDAIGQAVEAVARLAIELRAAGAASLRTLDAGGGWPIAYGHEPHEPASNASFGKAIRDALRRAGDEAAGLELIVEPGRAVVGDAGILLTQVIFTKQQAEKRFVIVDGAMTELLRPALYSAYHAIQPVQAPAADSRLSPADVVGPVCESSDFLALDRSLPSLARGDLLAVRGAGAYAASMASTYNARPRAPEVLVDGAQYHLVRKRERVEDLWRDEQMK
jgi:diaminopimelate decarboxylase